MNRRTDAIVKCALAVGAACFASACGHLNQRDSNANPRTQPDPAAASEMAATARDEYIALAFRGQDRVSFGIIAPKPSAPADIEWLLQNAVVVRHVICLHRWIAEDENRIAETVFDAETMLNPEALSIFEPYGVMMDRMVEADADKASDFDCRPHRQSFFDQLPKEHTGFSSVYVAKIRGQTDGNACLAMRVSASFGITGVDSAFRRGHYFGSMSELIHAVGNNPNVWLIDGASYLSGVEFVLANLFMPWSEEELKIWEDR